jgi:hypothetical protein
VAILDKSVSTVFFFNSIKNSRSAKATMAFRRIKEILAQHKLELLVEALQLHEVGVANQESPICGLICMENTRCFFRDWSSQHRISRILDACPVTVDHV